MAISASCPQCGHAVKVADHLAGKKIRCKECQAVYPVEAEESDDSADERPRSRSSAHASSAQADAKDSPPRRKRDEASKNKRRPQREGGGKGVLVAAAVVVVVLLLVVGAGIVIAIRLRTMAAIPGMEFNMPIWTGGNGIQEAVIATAARSWTGRWKRLGRPILSIW